MKKFFDSRRELGGSGPGLGTAGGGGAGSGGGSSFIGRVFNIGRYQVTVEEIVAEGNPCSVIVGSVKAFIVHMIRRESDFLHKLLFKSDVHLTECEENLLS